MVKFGQWTEKKMLNVDDLIKNSKTKKYNQKKRSQMKDSYK